MYQVKLIKVFDFSLFIMNHNVFFLSDNFDQLKSIEQLECSTLDLDFSKSQGIDVYLIANFRDDRLGFACGVPDNILPPPLQFFIR